MVLLMLLLGPKNPRTLCRQRPRPPTPLCGVLPREERSRKVCPHNRVIMKRLNTKDIGIRLALAGIGTALSVVFITLSYYVSFMSLSFTVLTSVGIMVPLSKTYYREGILTAIVAGVIGFFIANVRIVPYAMASGLYVVLTVFLYNKKINVIITTIAKLAYSCLIFWIIYKVVGVLVVNYEKLTFLSNFNENGVYALLNTVFSLAFLLYDYLLCKGYEYAKKLADKILKK